ncbi:hypothetical protein K2173_021320 [Erythroxylum novogranatense]|uniref:Exonuclease domain-containing protein n=1 Tax=Erythroxylum novogranatense TaxID=1862640 RepID=A0AAV8TY99_9ROSI|nr:hypothetical protein K2173_021320 [Erythroxylum novogranatense]
MEDKHAIAISSAPKKVLVDIVKLAQKHGFQGSKGSWTDFLDVYDPKIGSCFCDPARRSRETLVSFLQTFTEKGHVKFFARVLQKHSYLELLERIREESPEDESRVQVQFGSFVVLLQGLVRLTLQHPLYLSKYAFPTYHKGWVVTKLSKKNKSLVSDALLAIDCEMVLCEDGTDALVKICVVDHDLQVKLNELVRPCKPVVDYRTEITGISAADLSKATYSLADIQKSMKNLVSKRTILVGHSLQNDLRALKLDHSIVIDTSFIYRSADGLSPSLSNLCKSVLGYELREEGAAHDCQDDAIVAMKLVLAKIEDKVDNDLAYLQENVKNVPEAEMAKLLLHRIPITVPSEELQGALPVKFSVELKPPKNGQGKQYSVIAIFENPQEAEQAFDDANGRLEKDISGLPQKLISFKLSTGETASLYVRKMPTVCAFSQVSQKRGALEDDYTHIPKKLEKNAPEDYFEEIERLKQELKEKDSSDCDNHLKEIERLKQELKEKGSSQCNAHVKEIERLKRKLKTKDFEISTQDKIIAELKEKLKEMKKRKKS